MKCIYAQFEGVDVSVGYLQRKIDQLTFSCLLIRDQGQLGSFHRLFYANDNTTVDVDYRFLFNVANDKTLSCLKTRREIIPISLLIRDDCYTFSKIFQLEK